MLADSAFSEMFASMSVIGARRGRNGGTSAGVGGNSGGTGAAIGVGSGGESGVSGVSGVCGSNGGCGGSGCIVGGAGSGNVGSGAVGNVGRMSGGAVHGGSSGGVGGGSSGGSASRDPTAAAATALRLWSAAVSNDSGLGEESDFAMAVPAAASPLCHGGQNAAAAAAAIAATHNGGPADGNDCVSSVQNSAVAAAAAAAAALAAAGCRYGRVNALRQGLLGPSAAQACPDRLGVSGLLAELMNRCAGQPLCPWSPPTFFESVCHLRMRCPLPAAPSAQQQQQQQQQKLAAAIRNGVGAASPAAAEAPPAFAPAGSQLVYKPAHSLGRGNFGQVYFCFVQHRRPSPDGTSLCLPPRALKCTHRLSTHRKESLVHRRLQAGHTEDSYRSAFVLWLADSVQLTHAGSELGCLLLELAPGGSLQDLVGSLAKTGRMLVEREAAFYLAELGCAIDFLHSRGFLHLDVKADNVLIAANGHVRLCDLGHALALRDGRAESCLSAGLGTFHLPVEILRGGTGEHRVSIVTRATDWFSYGCLAFWLLHNYFPIVPPSYTRTVAEYADFMAGPGYRRLSRLFVRPASLLYRSLVLLLLHPDPDRRPASFGQVLLQCWPLFAECGLLHSGAAAGPEDVRAVIESNCLVPPFVPLPLC